MKKLIALLLACLMVAGLFAACGEPAEETKAPSAPAGTEPAGTEPAGTEPAATEPATEPVEGGEVTPPTGDMTFVLLAACILAAAAVVVLATKKVRN